MKRIHRIALLSLIMVMLLSLSSCESLSGGQPSGPPYPSVIALPETIDFGADANLRYLSISNAGAGMLEWSFVSKPAWIVTEADSGEIYSGLTQIIDIELPRDALPVGNSTGEIILETNGGNRTIPVLAEQSQSAVLGELVDSVDFGSLDDFLPLTIYNTGREELSWTLSIDNGLFTSSADSGSIMADTMIWIYYDREESPYDPATGTLTLETNGGDAEIVLSADAQTPPGVWLSQCPNPTAVYAAQPWDLLFITRFDRPFGWTQFTIDSIAILLDTAPGYYDQIQCYCWAMYQDSWGSLWPDLYLAYYASSSFDPYNGWSVWPVNWPLNADYFAVGYMQYDNLPYIYPNPYIDGSSPVGYSYLAWQEDPETIRLEFVATWDWCIEIHVSSDPAANGTVPQGRWLKPSGVVISDRQ
ncbi:hypothetical protein KKA08_07485, partial [bacterium]|nr:hypothetical protein [bacterium]